MIKVLAFPFIKGTKDFDDKQRTDLTEQFKKELAYATRLASFYEVSHRNMEVDSPMPLSKALVSDQTTCTHYGECDLLIFNRLDQTPMPVTKSNQMEHPTRVNFPDSPLGTSVDMNKKAEFVFMGNARCDVNSWYMRNEVFLDCFVLYENEDVADL